MIGGHFMAPLIRDSRFTEIYETKPDSKRRVTLGPCRVKAHHYRAVSYTHLFSSLGNAVIYSAAKTLFGSLDKA